MNWIHEFHQATKHSFAYLTLLGYDAHSEDYGTKTASVRFAKPGLDEVTVSACPVRLELNVTITGEDRTNFTSLYELEMINSDTELPLYEYGIYEAHLDDGKLKSVIHTLGERFRIIAMPLLKGEIDWKCISEWRSLQQQHKRDSELRVQISSAFADKRWGDVIIAINELGANADKLELKQLEYAKKQLN